MARKTLAAAVIILALTLGWGLYFHGEAVQALLNPERVTAETLVTREEVFLCGDVNLVYKGSASPELVGLDMAELLRAYPAEDGWALTFALPRQLVMVQKVNLFCPAHGRYRHLAEHQGFVAIYEGPLGYNQRLAKITGIPADSVPPNLRAQLNAATRYNSLSPRERAEVRETMEFLGDDDLHAFLENLDELQD